MAAARLPDRAGPVPELPSLLYVGVEQLLLEFVGVVAESGAVLFAPPPPASPAPAAV